MWIPEPNKALPQAYRERGVSIGDVGIITEDGQFDYLFNICEDEDHPVNGGSVAQRSTRQARNNLRTPAGFRPVMLDPNVDIEEVEVLYPPGSDISSTSMKRKEMDADTSGKDSQ